VSSSVSPQRKLRFVDPEEYAVAYGAALLEIYNLLQVMDGATLGWDKTIMNTLKGPAPPLLVISHVGDRMVEDFIGKRRAYWQSKLPPAYKLDPDHYYPSSPYERSCMIKDEFWRREADMAGMAKGGSKDLLVAFKEGVIPSVLQSNILSGQGAGQPAVGSKEQVLDQIKRMAADMKARAEAKAKAEAAGTGAPSPSQPRAKPATRKRPRTKKAPTTKKATSSAGS
jgi:hypothetical protein